MNKDTIYRQDAIDTLMAILDRPNHAEFLYTDEICKALGQLPSAQTEQRWIPVTERLPAYGEDVLLSIGKYCNVGYLVAVNDETDGEWHYSGWYHPMNDVSAWMPLPEPYKGEES